MSFKVELGEKAGFCFGVDRAVQLVEKLLLEGKKDCTLGPIIHNPQMVESLANSEETPAAMLRLLVFSESQGELF